MSRPSCRAWSRTRSRLDARGRGVGGAGASRAHRQGQMVEIPCSKPLPPSTASKCSVATPSIPIGPAGYKRMKERRPVRTRDGTLTMLPYWEKNWCTFFEAVGHPECIERFAVKDSVRARRISIRSTTRWPRSPSREPRPNGRIAASHRRSSRRVREDHRDCRTTSFESRRMIATLDHPSEGKIRQARPSARFSDTPAEIHRILPGWRAFASDPGEAGFTEEDVASMIETKVVGTSA